MAGAGDKLILAPGIYDKGLPVYYKSGTAENPLVIEGAKDRSQVVLRARKGANTISIVDSSYVIIRNLTINGNRQYVDGIKAEGHSEFSHHITLENIDIFNQGRHQQIVGISTKSPAWNWVVRGVRIYDAGTGMYFGDSDGYSPFINGIIENNKIFNTLGYNLQIKHQIVRRDEIPGMPTETGETIIRDNIFGKMKNSSIKHLARPNVLVGHWPLGGAGKDDVYKIYNNVFYMNPHEALFQGEGNIELHNNIFYRDTENNFPAIAIQPHNCVPKNISINGNTVVTRGTGIRIMGGDKHYSQKVTGNNIFADVPVIGGEQENNQQFTVISLQEKMPEIESLLEKLRQLSKQGYRGNSR